MTTQLAYFDDTDKIRDSSLIVASKKDEYGPYLLLNSTIFTLKGVVSRATRARWKSGHTSSQSTVLSTFIMR